MNRIEYPEMKINQDIHHPEMFSGPAAHSFDVPTMVTINEAKAITGLSYGSLRRMCLNNEIVHIRVGAKYLINLERLIAKLNGETD